jgi:hypothetical protein
VDEIKECTKAAKYGLHYIEPRPTAMQPGLEEELEKELADMVRRLLSGCCMSSY